MKLKACLVPGIILLAAAGGVWAGPVMEALEKEITAIVETAIPAVVTVRTAPVPCHPYAGIPEEELPDWVRPFLENRLVEPRPSTGSGFFIDSSGLILTTENVVRGAPAVEVVLIDGRVLPARLLGSDRDFNLALLEVKGDEPFLALEMGDSNRIRPGAWAIVIGNPFGLAGSVSWGLIGGLQREGLGTALYENLIQINADINPGDSGGPLLDCRGKVIGVVTATLSGYREPELDWPFLHRYHGRFSLPGPGDILRPSLAQGIGFAVPSALATEVVDRIRENPRPERGWLGLRLGDIPAWSRARRQLPRGVLVLDVMAGSPAEIAGLRPDDIIVSYQGKEVCEAFQLKKELLFSRAGEEIRLGVCRDGAPAAVIEITALPAPAGSREAKGE